MRIVDDNELVLLARKPPAALFPLLRRPTTLAPLLMLVCTLPPLFAAMRRTATEADAIWSIRAMERPWIPGLVSSHAPPEGAAGALRAQPPLGSWLTWGLLQLAPSRHSLWHMAAPVTFAALGVALFVLVMRTLFSPRVAFWSGLAGGFQAAQLALAGRWAPSSIGLFFLLVTFWGFLSHLDRTARHPRWRLAAGGLALGCCLLSGGPTALGGLAILTLHVLGLRGQSLSRGFAEPKPVDVWTGLPALRSLAVMALVGGLLGGGWSIANLRVDGSSAWVNWLLGAPDLSARGVSGVASPINADAVVSAGERWGRLPMLCGPLAGLSLLGMIHAAIAMLRSEEEPRRRGQQFLLVWAFISIFAWSLTTANANAGAFVVGQWEALIGLAMAGLAAVAIDGVTSRRISLTWFVAAAAPGAVVLAAAGWGHGNADALHAGILLTVVLVLGAIAAAAWKPLDGTTDRDFWQRFIIGTLVVAHVSAAVVYGLRSTDRQTADDVALRTFRRGLPSEPAITEIVFIGPSSRVPMRIRQVVRAAYPRAEVAFADSWEAVLARALADPSDERRVLLAVDWQGRDSRATAMQASGVHVSPSATVQFFEGGALRAFVVRRATTDQVAARTPVE